MEDVEVEVIDSDSDSKSEILSIHEQASISSMAKCSTFSASIIKQFLPETSEFDNHCYNKGTHKSVIDEPASNLLDTEIELKPEESDESFDDDEIQELQNDINGLINSRFDKPQVKNENSNLITVKTEPTRNKDVSTDPVCIIEISDDDSLPEPTKSTSPGLAPVKVASDEVPTLLDDAPSVSRPVSSPLTESLPFIPILKEEFLKMRNMLKEKYRGHTYYKQFRLFCLHLYFNAPKVYKLFQNYLAIPSGKKLLQTKINLPSGCNKNFVELVSKQLKKMPTNAKYITLCLNEMNLRDHMYYDIRNDEIIGYCDVDGKKRLKTASTAFIISIKGCFYTYEQLISYGLFANTDDYKDICEWLNNTIKLLFEVGYIVCAVVCNQTFHMNNLAIVKGITPEKPFFIVGIKRIFFLFDIPNLMNSIRNELLTSTFVYEEYKLASWEYIKTFHNNQSLRKIKLAPKLSSSHIEPALSQCYMEKITKEIFSYSVAVGIASDIELGLQNSDALGTVEFIMKMNDLYDVLSSTKTKKPRNYKKPFTGADYQNKCILDAYSIFLGIKTFDSITGLQKNQSDCFQGILITLQGLSQLHNYFVSSGIKSVFTKALHLNSKKLLLELTSQSSPRNLKLLTPIEFKRSFSKLALKQLINHSGVIYSKTDLDIMLRTGNDKLQETDFSLLEEYLPNAPNMSPLRVGTTGYRNVKSTDIHKYVFNECLTIHYCNDLKRYASENIIADQGSYVEVDPPKYFNEYVNECQTVIRDEFDNIALRKQVGANLLRKVEAFVTPMNPCQCFPQDHLKKLIIRMIIYMTLKSRKKYKRDS